MTLLLAIFVFLFSVYCAFTAVTKQRKQHAKYLYNIDARIAQLDAQQAAFEKANAELDAQLALK